MFKKVIIYFLPVLLLSFIFSPIKVFGEQIDPSVSPAIINLSLKPGDDQKSSYTYFNDTSEDINISLDARAFRPSNGEHGTPLFQDASGKQYSSPITDWISFEKNSYDVPANGNVEIGFTIKVPNDTVPGKYFAALFNVENTGQPVNGSNIKKEVGVTLVADVLSVRNPTGKIGFFNIWTRLLLVVLILILLAGVLIVCIRLKKKNKNIFSWIKRKREKHV